jgi:hypothetical protein
MGHAFCGSSGNIVIVEKDGYGMVIVVFSILGIQLFPEDGSCPVDDGPENWPLPWKPHGP